MKDFEIIDFHTHPFISREDNICNHIDNCNMSAENTKKDLQSIGISMICGCVASFSHEVKSFDDVRYFNDQALELKKMYGDFYYPGFHVHPSYVRESLEEVERMHAMGLNLVGEIVPYMQGWADYSCPEFYEILELCEQYDMVVNLHSILEREEEIDKLVRDHPHLTIVAAHPGEYWQFERHMQRMGMSENYCIDLSGYGIFRHGMVRHAIDLYGADRIIFGSDYPTCNPAMYIGGVRDDFLLTDTEKEKILSLNAKRLLKI